MAPTMTVEHMGTQVEQRTYADVLAQIEVMVSVVATTDTMDIDEPTTTIMPPAPPAVKDQLLPLPIPFVRAFVVHSFACAGPFAHKIQEVERTFRGKGGVVIGVRCLLHWSKRKGKTTCSLVVYLKKTIKLAKDMSVRMCGRKYTIVECQWDRKGRAPLGW